MEKTEKEIQITNELSRLIPNVKILNSRAGNQNGVFDSKYFISPENLHLSNSEYSYNGKLNFIHFTSLAAIQSIITERSLRMYNLRNLNDPREYSFAGNLITLDIERRKDAKDNIYLLSMCETELLTSNLTTDIEFNMWRLYGDNGQGIALELSFEESDPKNWHDYFVSKIHYGASSKTNIKELNKLLKKLEQDIPKTIVDLAQIVCFHKSRLFKLEKEIRILYDNREKRIFAPIKYRSSDNEIYSPVIRTEISKSSTKDNEVKYLELPIFHSKFKPISSEGYIPIPKIEKIILGYQFKDNFQKVSNHIKQLCISSLGYEPIIEKSRLTKWYHESE